MQRRLANLDELQSKYKLPGRSSTLITVYCPSHRTFAPPPPGDGDPGGEQFVVTACFCYNFIVMTSISALISTLRYDNAPPGSGTCFANRNLIYRFTLLTATSFAYIYNHKQAKLAESSSAR